MLVISILVSLGIIAYQLFVNAGLPIGERLNSVSEDVQNLPWAIIAFILSFIPDYMEKHGNIYLPDILEVAIVVFVFASIYLSGALKLYYKFFWWDDFLHTISGVIIGFIGFLLVYKMNRKYTMNLSPLLVAFIAFSFSITGGVLWEIFEFSIDTFFGAAMQKWNLSSDTLLMGKAYQGVGLRDTMSDLILDTLGALFTSTVCYFLYKDGKGKVISLMQKTFPEKE